MADNFDFTSSGGSVGAAKNVGGVLYPQVIATEIDGTDTGIAAKLGPVTETAPATDTASSGINGRLQRIAQRLTTLMGSTIAVSGTFWQSVQPVSGTFWQATQPISAASLPLPTGAAVETGGHLAAIDTAQGTQADTAWTSGNGSVIALLKAVVGKLAGTLTASISGSVAVTGTFWQTTQPVSIATAPVLVAGTALIGKVGIDQTTIGTTNGVTPIPAASGGPTLQRIKAAASTNATSVKASAGQIYGWALFNTTASELFVKVYNKASSPTVGTDTPAFTIPIPASGGTNIEFSMGIPLGTGIAFAITGAIADSDTTTVAADSIHGLLLYK